MCVAIFLYTHLSPILFNNELLIMSLFIFIITLTDVI